MALQKPEFQANGVYKTYVGGKLVYSRDGSNVVTVTKFLQLLMILELYLELNYFPSLIVTVTWSN